METQEDAQARRRLEIQCKILEIDNQGVTWQREQFRKLLLEQVGAQGDAGQSAPQPRPQWPQPESGRPVSSLSPLVTHSGPHPLQQQVPPSARQDDSAISSGPTSQWHQVQPSARQEDIGSGRHRSVFTCSTYLDRIISSILPTQENIGILRVGTTHDRGPPRHQSQARKPGVVNAGHHRQIVRQQQPRKPLRDLQRSRTSQSPADPTRSCMVQEDSHDILDKLCRAVWTDNVC